MTFEIQNSNKTQKEKVGIHIYNSDLERFLLSKTNASLKGTLCGIFIITNNATTESLLVPISNLINVISAIKQNNISNINSSIQQILPQNHSAIHIDLLKKFCEIAQNFDSKLDSNDELAIKNWLIQNQPNQLTKNIEIFFYYDGNILSLNPNTVSGDCTVQY